MINAHGQKSLPSAFSNLANLRIKVAIVLVWLNFSIKLNKISDKLRQDKTLLIYK